MEKAVFCWSGGKDSAMALHDVRRAGRYDILTLLTVVTEDYDRISMHGVRNSLLDEQAKSLGLALEKVIISKKSSDVEYESKMRSALQRYAERGVESVIFGDIFLEDLRKYREDKLAIMNMKGIFPIWKAETGALAGRFISSGFKAVITCVDSKALPEKFAGREFDESLLADLPEGVDPCGENGEFHSFVYDGPGFNNKIDFTIGEVVLRDNRFYFADLVPTKGQCA